MNSKSISIYEFYGISHFRSKINERLVKLTTQKKEEMDLLSSVKAAAKEPQKEDDFDLFGQYVASKMRKLSKSLTDEAMETVEFNITSLLNKAKMQNVTPEPSYHQIE